MRQPKFSAAAFTLAAATVAVPNLAAQDAPANPGASSSSAPVDMWDYIESFEIGGLLRMSYDLSGDDVYEFNGEEIDGVRFQDAQVWFEVDTGIFDVRIMGKAADSNSFPPISSNGDVDSFDIRDAWVRAELSDGLHVYAGKYKCPLVASANVDYGSLLFIDRTRIGQLFSAEGAYQPGAALTYDNEHFHAKLALQNGADGIVDAYGMVARAEYKVMGGASYREGALGSPDGDLEATLGVGYFQDGSDVGGDDFGSGAAADCYATYGPVSLHAEVLDMDEELAMKAVGNLTDDATPYSVTLGYLINEEFEVAARFQDMNNDADTTLIGGGLNYYLRGHDSKLQLNVAQFDENDEDGVLFQVGLAVGFGKRWEG